MLCVWGIKQLLSVNLMPAALFVWSEVIGEIKGPGGSPSPVLLQVFYFSLDRFQSVGNTRQRTVNSKSL